MDFPDWIQSSPLYKELLDTYGDVNEFVHTLPPIYCDFHINLTDPYAFIQFVNTLKYWCVGVDQVPVHFFEAILEYIYYFIRENTELSGQLSETLNSFDPNILLFLNHNVRFDRERGMLDYAIMIEHLPLIYYMKITKSTIVIFGWELYRTAIKYKSLKSFIFLETKIFQRDPKLPFLENGLFQSCLTHNAIDILKYIYTDACLTECDMISIVSHGCDNLSYECLEFLFEKGISINESAVLKACIRTLKLLQLIFRYSENIESIRPEDKNYNMCFFITFAASRGKYDCVEFLYNFYPQIVWRANFKTAHETISSSYFSLQTLDFLLSKGVPVTEETTALACKVGNLDALKLLRQYGCPWDKECLKNAALFDKEDCFLYAFENGCPRPKYCVFG